MNRWNIPSLLEAEVNVRDKDCVYCRIAFSNDPESRRNWATWEHIINDINIITYENIVKCCWSCNSSKGAKTLENWLESEYCKRRGITRESVSEVVRSALDHAAKSFDTNAVANFLDSRRCRE